MNYDDYPYGALMKTSSFRVFSIGHGGFTEFRLAKDVPRKKVCVLKNRAGRVIMRDVQYVGGRTFWIVSTNVWVPGIYSYPDAMVEVKEPHRTNLLNPRWRMKYSA